jgi:hypothetical protein
MAKVVSIWASGGTKAKMDPVMDELLAGFH